MTESYSQAPAWQVERWFNTSEPLSLERLRGKVIVLEAFQMLCPGCVSEGLPQAQRVQATFPSEQVAVIGLHTVFEHHQAMTPVSLEAFLYEYRITFPVAVDLPDPRGSAPLTMRAYAMHGTPSMVLIDKQGRIRQHYFGRVNELQLGAQIAWLIAEAGVLNEGEPLTTAEQASGCADGVCAP
ncbi:MULTISPECIES: peroxiredoxin family protein [unclassified Pseudomonas]|uniref:peroxiredoxin family protein n=1 Tax=unclassified Pseudomonas TaxID=196821 RepID=UPI0023B8EE0A|nr:MULTISPECIES: redoxin domain-containing protein [unclassified Pseudomonas]